MFRLDFLLHLGQLLKQELLFLLGLHRLEESLETERWILGLLGLLLILSWFLVGIFFARFLFDLLSWNSFLKTLFYFRSDVLHLNCIKGQCPCSIRTDLILSFGILIRSENILLLLLLLQQFFLSSLLLPTLLFKFLVLLLSSLLLLFDLANFIHDNLQTISKERLQLFILCQVELNKGALSGKPSLTRFIAFLIFLEELSHLALD